MSAEEILVKRFRHQDVLDLIERKYKQVGITVSKDNIEPEEKEEKYDCKMLVAGDDKKDLKRFTREAKRLGLIEKG